MFKEKDFSGVMQNEEVDLKAVECGLSEQGTFFKCVPALTHLQYIDVV